MEQPTQDGTTPQNAPTEPGRHLVRILKIEEFNNKKGDPMILIVVDVLQSSAPENKGREKATAYGKTGNFKAQNGIALANLAAACGKYAEITSAFPGDVSFLDEGPVAWMADNLVLCTFFLTDEWDKKGAYLNWMQMEPDGGGNGSLGTNAAPAPPPIAAPSSAPVAPAPAPTAPPPPAGPSQAEEEAASEAQDFPG